MTTKADQLYDVIRPAVNNLFSEELRDPYKQDVIDDLISDFINAMEDDNLQTSADTYQQEAENYRGSQSEKNDIALEELRKTIGQPLF